MGRVVCRISFLFKELLGLSRKMLREEIVIIFLFLSLEDGEEYIVI